MALRRSDEHTRVLRQSVVSSAKLRGMTSQEIVDFLVEKEIVNPRTGKPWSISTINGDVKEQENIWRNEMYANISDHRARVLAELRETKKAAWQGGKLSLVLRSIQQEVDLLGLNELERMGVEIALANLFKGFPKEIADELKKLLAARVQKGKHAKQGSNLIEMKKVVNER